jgi:hypothetical protein
MRWAQRLKRVFGIDIETCIACGGTMRIIACIENPAVIEAILANLAGKARPVHAPRLPPGRAPPASAFSQSAARSVTGSTAFTLMPWARCPTRGSAGPMAARGGNAVVARAQYGAIGAK